MCKCRLKWAGLLPFVRLVEATHDEVEGEQQGIHIRRLQYDTSLLTCLIGPLREPPANWKLEMAQRFDGVRHGQSAFDSDRTGEPADVDERPHPYYKRVHSL